MKSKFGRRTSVDEYINDVIKVHGNKYDYSLLTHFNRESYDDIICSKHGIFRIKLGRHLDGYGCPKCALENRRSPLKLTTEQFIEKAWKVHGSKYDYSKAEYKNKSTPVEIVCSIHGSFYQRPDIHLRGAGCPKCSGNLVSQEDFIEKANSIHHHRYDYSLVEYINTLTPVKIICPIHGVFEQKPREHIQGSGCPVCGGTSRSNTRDFIEKAKRLFPEYDYSKVDYKNNRTKVEVICKDHGSFFIKLNDLLNNHGCPFCNSSNGERRIKRYLDEKGIEYIQQKSFPDLFCKDRFHPLKFDFYIPSINTCIEYQGIQHYKPLGVFGGKEGLRESKRRDNLKREYCQIHNIELLEIKYGEDVEDILTKLFFPKF